MNESDAPPKVAKAASVAVPIRNMAIRNELDTTVRNRSFVLSLSSQ